MKTNREWAELIAAQYETDEVDAIEEGVARGRLLGGEPVAYLRDLDGTGSLHVCAKGDPGAIAVAPSGHPEDL